jgi:glycosyltransferase involved in cell wall biosynthesis
VRIALLAYTRFETDARVKRAVEALVERGHRVDVFVVSSAGVRPAADNENLRIYRLRMRKERRAGGGRYVLEWGVFFAWSFALLSILHVWRRYRVVYANNMPNFIVFAGLIPKITGAKVILDVHDPVAELLACIRERELPGWLRLIVNAEERVSLSFADSVITVNESMRRRLSLVTRNPVAVVMNLPDPANFGLRERSSHAEKTQLLVYSGTVAHRFGLDLVVRAVSALAAEFPLLRLRIVGEGPAIESLRQLAEAEGVADRVEFRDPVPNHEIPALMDDALAGVSAQREDAFGSLVFSMKVAEYVALGLPVVCAGTTTMRYYFDDDEIIFFKPEDAEDLTRAIREVLSDPAVAERSAKCRIKLDKLSWSVQKDTLMEIVEKPKRSRG